MRITKRKRSKSVCRSRSGTILLKSSPKGPSRHFLAQKAKREPAIVKPRKKRRRTAKIGIGSMLSFSRKKQSKGGLLKGSRVNSQGINKRKRVKKEAIFSVEPMGVLFPVFIEDKVQGAAQKDTHDAKLKENNKERITFHIYVRNLLSEKSCFFKIKTTSPLRYTVQPNMAQVECGQVLPVKITMEHDGDVLSTTQILQDKFRIDLVVLAKNLMKRGQLSAEEFFEFTPRKYKLILNMKQELCEGTSKGDFVVNFDTHRKEKVIHLKKHSPRQQTRQKQATSPLTLPPRPRQRHSGSFGTPRGDGSSPHNQSRGIDWENRWKCQILLNEKLVEQIAQMRSGVSVQARTIQQLQFELEKQKEKELLINSHGQDGGLGLQGFKVPCDDTLKEMSLEKLQKMKECVGQSNDVIQKVYSQKLELENSRLKDEKMCCVCMCYQKNVLFLSCNHICLCQRCYFAISLKNNICPLCRTPIDGVVLDVKL